jgi:hypothetical protein
MTSAFGTVLVVGGGAGVLYGLLDILFPAVAIRWQVASTSKARGSRQAVGSWFQQMLGVDPDAAPWDDPSIRKKVRWMGVALAVLSLAAVLAGLALLRRP